MFKMSSATVYITKSFRLFRIDHSIKFHCICVVSNTIEMNDLPNTIETRNLYTLA